MPSVWRGASACQEARGRRALSMAPREATPTICAGRTRKALSRTFTEVVKKQSRHRGHPQLPHRRRGARGDPASLLPSAVLFRAPFVFRDGWPTPCLFWAPSCLVMAGRLRAMQCRARDGPPRLRAMVRTAVGPGHRRALQWLCAPVAEIEEGWRQKCDVCETSILDRHWACTVAGCEWEVCLQCHRAGERRRPPGGGAIIIARIGDLGG